MQLRLLRYLTAVASERHFARAAEICGVSQPTLSAGLAALERQLGKRLVERDRRFIGLTPEGEAVLPWAQQLIAARDGMVHALDAVTGPIRGELKIGSIPAAMPALGILATALMESYPGLTIAVRSLTSREIERDLAAFELDAGLTYLDHEPPVGILSVPLYMEHYVFLTRRGAFEQRTGISWEEAVSTPLCLLHQGMQNRRILDACLARRGLASHPKATADSYVALLAMVQSGAFSSIVPDSYLALLPGLEWAQSIPFTEPEQASRIGLIILNRTPLTPFAGAAMTTAKRLGFNNMLQL